MSAARMRIAPLVLLLAAMSARSDILVNDRTGDAPGAIQSSPCVTEVFNSNTIGSMVVVAWGNRSTPSTQSRARFAVAPLNGSSFTNGGAPPTPVGYVWSLDDIVHRAGAFDESGIFYLTGILRTPASPPGVGIGFARGIVDMPNSVSFDRVQMIANFGTEPSAQLFGGISDMQVNQADNTIFLAYNPSLVGGVNRNVYFIRSTNGGVTWSQPTRVSSDSVTSPPGSALVDVGSAAGDVTFLWYQADANPDYVDVWSRHSADNGTTLGSPVLVMRTPLDEHLAPSRTGPGRGSLARTLNGIVPGSTIFAETAGLDLSQDVFPSLASAATVVEAEPNGTAATANLVFPVGDVVRGTLSAVADSDLFAFDLAQGQEVNAWLDSIPDFWQAPMIVNWIGTDGHSVISYGFAQSATTIQKVGFVAPSTARYSLCLTTTFATGGYRLRTVSGADPPSGATDQGDLAFSILPSGGSWTGFERNNTADPIGYDATGVALASVADGSVDVSYNDFSVAPGRAQSRRVLRRSTDGGATWSAPVTLSSVNTDWAVTTGSDGPFCDMESDGVNVFTVWSDGRNGDPDIYFSYLNRRIFVDNSPPFELTAHQGETVHALRSVQNADALESFAVRMDPLVDGWTLSPSTGTLGPGQTAPLDCTFQVPNDATPGDVTVTIDYESADNPPGPPFTTGPVYGIATLTLHVLSAAGVPPAATPILALGAVRPNPFAGAGEVRYSLPRAEHVRIAVYALDGRLVRVLADDDRPAGPQSAVWDGRDAAGRRAASGAYFVAMHAEGRSFTRRVVMLR